MPPAPSPLLTLLSLAIMGGIGAILTIGPWVWYVVIRRVYRGESVLEHEPRQLATWGFVDIVVFVVIWIGMAVAIGGGIGAVTGINLFAKAEATDNTVRLYLMFIDSVARLVSMAVVGLFIMVRTRCSLRDIGFSLADLPGDLRLGALAFCALAIPTFGLQAVLTQFWKSEHPLIESLKLEPDLQFLAIAMFAAVIAAPLAEEFGFRVLFQGWLEKMFDPAAAVRPNFGVSLFIGEPADSDNQEPLLAQLNPSAETAYVEPEIIDLSVARPDAPSNPYQAPVVGEIASPASPVPAPLIPRWIVDFLSIAISALVFSIVHYSHGPDWLSLIGLSLGIGYLYRRTHRITPGLVVHFLLNLLSMLGLCLMIYGEQMPK